MKLSKKRRLRIRNKIVYRFLTIGIVMVLCAIVVIGTTSYNLSYIAIKNNSEKFLKASVHQMTETISTRMTHVETLQHNFFFGENSEELCKIKDHDLFTNEISHLLYSLVSYYHSYISEVYFLDMQLEEYYPSSLGARDIMKQVDGLQYESIADFSDQIEGSPVWKINDNGHVIMNRCLIEKNLKNYGYLQMQVKESYLLSYASDSQSTMYLLQDKNGSICNLTEELFPDMIEYLKQYTIQQEFCEISLGSQNYLVVSSQIDGKDMTLYGIVLMDDLIFGLRSSTITLVLICVCVFIMVTVFMALMTHPVANNMNQLLNRIRMYSPQSEEIVEQNFKHDEIGVISQYMNQMAEKLEQLVCEAYEAELAKQAAEYKLLQFQYYAMQEKISPHFLYNTLESISSSAKLANDPLTSEFICTLARMLRANISDHRKTVPVADEIETVRQYLILQKLNFGDRLDYEILMSPQVQNVAIPKLLLQPIVENAIRHGIENKVSGGLIVIEIKTENGKREISDYSGG